MIILAPMKLKLIKMKIILTVSMLFLLASTITFGQKLSQKLSGKNIYSFEMYKMTDTIPKVFYTDSAEELKKPIMFLNGKDVTEKVFRALDPNDIEGIEVKKKPEIENHPGEIHITTKENCSPKFISLNELKMKYLENLEGPVLFILNEKPINSDYDNFVVDEKYILKILVSKIDNQKEGLDINIVTLITRTKENVEKANTIVLRGDLK